MASLLLANRLSIPFLVLTF